MEKQETLDAIEKLIQHTNKRDKTYAEQIASFGDPRLFFTRELTDLRDNFEDLLMRFYFLGFLDGRESKG